MTTLVECANEAQEILVADLGDQRWVPVLSLSPDLRLKRNTLEILDTYVLGQKLWPDNYKIPLTIVVDTIEAVLGRQITGP